LGRLFKRAGLDDSSLIIEEETPEGVLIRPADAKLDLDTDEIPHRRLSGV